MFGKKKNIIAPEPVTAPTDKVWLVHEHTPTSNVYYQPDRVTAAEMKVGSNYTNNLTFIDSKGTLLRSYHHWNKVIYLGTEEEVRNG